MIFSISIKLIIVLFLRQVLMKELIFLSALKNISFLVLFNNYYISFSYKY